MCFKEKRRKKRMRSRNPYIDAMLAEEEGGDDFYNDLEDFIVCKKGTNYNNYL